MNDRSLVRVAARLSIVVLVLGAFFLLREAGGAAVGEPLLPDLTMSVPTDLRTEGAEAGGTVLRFTSIMNNLGAGDLIVDGVREDGDWQLSQEVRHESGSSKSSLDAGLVWGGDGHDHWHVVGAARYRLESPEGPLGADRYDHKVGFCIFDSVAQATDLPGAPAGVFYRSEGCGLASDDEVAMGLSVGWGDRYRSSLPGQWIDITDLPDGLYRLVAQVDPDGLFTESDTTNNEAWTDFEIISSDSETRVVVVGGGPEAV